MLYALSSVRAPFIATNVASHEPGLEVSSELIHFHHISFCLLRICLFEVEEQVCKLGELRLRAITQSEQPEAIKVFVLALIARYINMIGVKS